MKKTNVIYWVFTGLMTALLGLGSVFDAISAPEAVAHVTQLGYPAYLVPFLGVAKLVALVVILIPGFPRLKEWAYAGLVIDVVGAMYSHIAVGEAPGTWAPISVILLLITGSYVYHHKRSANSQARPVRSVHLAGSL